MDCFGIICDSRPKQLDPRSRVQKTVAECPLRVESSGDLIMVYGTSTNFDPQFLGRIGSSVESAPLPPEWAQYRSLPSV